MKKTERTYHLKNILDLKHNMKIVIDEAVELDEDDNFLINVGYLRVSTDRQADLGFGLDIQEADIVRWCTANGYKNLVLFIDDGYTGTNMERPALQEIMGAITDFNTGKSHIRVNSLVVARIDRLGRSLLGTLQFIQDYIVAAKDSKNSAVNRNREDINFVSVAENYCRIDKDNPQGKFLLMLFATLAEFDRDQIVEKLKRGRQARVASGKWMGGGKVPFGYRYNKETSSLEVVPEEAEVVREIFRFQRRPGDPSDPDAQVPHRLHHLQRRGIRGQPRGHHLPGDLAGGAGGAAAAQRQPNGLQLSALGPGILRRMRREDALSEMGRQGA